MILWNKTVCIRQFINFTATYLNLTKWSKKFVFCNNVNLTLCYNVRLYYSIVLLYFDFIVLLYCIFTTCFMLIRKLFDICTLKHIVLPCDLTLSMRARSSSDSCSLRSWLSGSLLYGASTASVKSLCSISRNTFLQ